MNQSVPKHFKRNSLSALIGLSLALQSGLSLAQEEATEEEGGYERIMITASKRTTGLQETPIAVTVVGSEAIEQAKVLDIGDLQTLVPTLRVTPLQRSTNTNFAIRGFGNGTNNTGIEPSVGVFIDGVYRSRAAAQIGDLPRLSQIEVLSGPQSTLFGKNASAGVISVRTEAPAFDMEGKVEAGIGNYNQRILKGYITNGITDNLAFSLSGGMNTRDGYTKSVVGLNDVNDRDRWNIRGQALYQPTEDVSLRFIADYSEIDENCCTVADIINGPTTPAARIFGVVLDESDPFSFESALNADQNNTVEDGGVSLQVDVDFDGFAFTSITAMRNNESDFTIDPDYTSMDMLYNTGYANIDTFTQEFRLTSTGENKLDWMVGAFIFQEDVESGENIGFGVHGRPFFDVLLGAALDPTLISFGLPTGILSTFEGLYGQAPGTFLSSDTAVATDFTQKNDAYSIFANFDYHLSESLTATFGVSYTKDEKDVTVSETNNDRYSAIDFDTTLTVFQVPLAASPAAAYANFIPAIAPLQFLPPKLVFPNAVEDGSSSDSDTTWSARLAYTLNRNVNFFATAATGFKASSWNLSRDTRPFDTDMAALTTAGLTQANQTYGTRKANPEEATVYELGMKTSFKEGAFNITLFDQTIKGFQSSIFNGTGFVLANAGEQNTKGIEFDSVYRATDNLSLTLAGTFLDPEYVSFVGANGVSGPVDLSGQQPAGIHEQSITFGITYNHEFDNGMFGYVRSDYIYESEAELVENVPKTRVVNGVSIPTGREVSTVNASAGLNFDNGVNLQLWVRNITNDEYFMSGFPTPLQGGSFNAYPNQPRTYGLSVSYEFY